MASSILDVGKSALTAAQAGLSVTGHNIANASTPGYTRQVVVQGAIPGENTGFGFIGKGTEVSTIKRVYSEFLNNQVLAAQTGRSQLSTYYTQIQQINNMLADTSTGLSPALQEFFKGVQDVSADPSGAASRQSMLSASESLASRFKSLDGQMREIGQGINAQISTSVAMVNVYAQQIAKLNDAIEKAQSGADGKPANDLLDQRDLAVSELSKEVKVNVVKQGSTYNVFIGNGQPLVVNTKTSTLSMAVSPTDPSRQQIAYINKGERTILPDNAFTSGGKLGGLLEFRASTLEPAVNQLGRIATVLGMTFNAQHKLGQTQSGGLGADFFKIAPPLVTPANSNIGNGVVAASITDPTALTGSDYRVQYVPANGMTPASVKVVRMTDGQITEFAPPEATVDGVKFTLTGTPASTDDFLVRPTANGAAAFSVLITNKASIAAAAPIRSGAPATNSGTGKITAPVIESASVMAPVTLTYTAGTTSLSGFPAGLDVTVTIPGAPPTVTTYAAGTPVPYTSGATISFGGADIAVSGVLANGATVTVGPPTATLTYNSGANTLTGFPANMPVTVEVGGVSTTYAPGAAVPYTDGAKVTVGGMSFIVSGAPANGDTFTLAANTNGQGDSRNAVALGQLQIANLFDEGTATYQGAFSQIVNTIGNKTRELEATSGAAETTYTTAFASQQSESGVNLDEEATQLLRYQQAYQAAAKVMQTASQLFDTLLALNNR